MSGTYSEGLAPFLVEAARKEGFADVSVISVREIYRKITEYSENYGRPDVKTLRTSLERTIDNPEEGSFLVCALPYAVRRPGAPEIIDSDSRPGQPDALLFPGPPPYARIAPFAARHYYRAAVEKLDRVKKLAVTGFGMSESDFRPFSNSRIPEKPIFWASGLGMYGRNGLIIHPELGTRFVIAMLFVRRILPDATGIALRPPGSSCGGCAKCAQACPGGALAGDGTLDTSRCLQARATRLEAWDDETKLYWGKRLYGCDICQETCPQNRKAFRDSDVTIGTIGESVSLQKFLALDESGMKTALKGTALGMPWISLNSIIRNAIVAVGNSFFEKAGVTELIALTKKFRQNPDPSVADAAKWTLEKLEINIG